MAEDRILHDQNISGVSAQNNSQVFAGSAQNVYFANPQSSQEQLAKAIIQCRSALFLTDPRIDRESLITAKGTRVPGTCEWVKNHVSYRAWLTCGGDDDNCENHNNSRLLWIAGGPGKGKTMMSIFLTEELESHVAHTENSELLFFFCSAPDEKRNTGTAVLRGLLHQIISKRPQLIEYALPHFETPQQGQQTLSSLEALWISFRTMVLDIEFGTMFCVIDGLDECEESTRKALVSRLVGLLKGPAPSNKSLVRLAIISRDIPGLQDCPKIQLDPDNDEKVVSDIEQFVSARVKELSQIKEFNDDPKKCVHVQRELLTRANGTFLWVGFAMDELLQKHTWTDILCSLKELPNGLPAIYSRMLLGIPNEHIEMSRLILFWVTLAVRPLQLEELAAATYIHSSSPHITKKQATLDAIFQCRPLLQVRENEIGFIHQSARDYLLRENQDDNKVLEKFRINPQKAHLEILRTCISCMVQSGLKHSANVLDDETCSQESALLAYAAFHWPEHAKSCSARDAAFCDTLKQFFHEEFIVLRNWWIAYRKGKKPRLPSDLSLFHIQCYFGLVPLVEEIVASKWIPRFLRRINKKDGVGNTALHLAVESGNRDLVRILIDNGAQLNAVTIGNTTPLHVAVQREDVKILQLLLHKGADANAKGKSSKTVLYEAVMSGNETVTLLLLNSGVDVNAKNGCVCGRLHTELFGKSQAAFERFFAAWMYVDMMNKFHAETQPPGFLTLPLQWPATRSMRSPSWMELPIATEAEEELLARIYLDKVSGAKFKGICGETALHAAVYRGNEAVARLLLDRGADVNAKGIDGRTVLHQVVLCHQVHVTTATMLARLLLHRGADMNAKDCKGMTALQLAAEYRHEVLVQLLKQEECKRKSGSIYEDSR